jgi:hypothetical protein
MIFDYSDNLQAAGYYLEGNLPPPGYGLDSFHPPDPPEAEGVFSRDFYKDSNTGTVF